MPNACAASSASATCAITSTARPGGTRPVAVEQVREVGAVDVAHRHVEVPVLLARRVDRDHVRVVDRGGDLALAPEARAELVVLGLLGRDHLQRDLALEALVERAVDDAHPAAPATPRIT